MTIDAGELLENRPMFAPALLCYLFGHKMTWVVKNHYVCMRCEEPGWLVR